MTYVIVGNGIAALRAAEAIRARDAEGTIKLITDEAYPVYSRPLTSYLVAGWVTDERMPVRDTGHYDKLRVDLVLGRKAIAVDAEAKIVTLEGGEQVSYDKLLLATGAAPKPTDIGGAHLSGVHGLRTWDDSREILERLQKTQHAVVIGGGFVGMSTARALLSRGIQVTVVVSSNRVLSMMLPLEAADLVRRRVEDKGMKISTGTDVVEILGDDASGVTGVKLQGGETIKCELVIVGKGVNPRLDLAKSAGLDIGDAIWTDSLMRTSNSDIYAAGDCVESFDHLRNQRRSAAIWPNAAHQGRVAGANMAGARHGAEGFFGMNALDFSGLSLIAGGITLGGEGYEVLREQGESANGNPWFRQIVFDGDKLVGFVLVGEIKRAGILTGLIRKQVSCRSFAETMLSPGFDMMKLPVQLRKQMLATVNPLAAQFSA